MPAACLSDYQALARARLPRLLFDYIDGGSYGEVTLRRNVSDFEAVQLRQRVLRDVSAIDLKTTLFGKALAMPLALGPVGMAGMFARRGEAQASRAAAKAGVPFCLSTVGVCGLEEVTRASGIPPWFQLYMIKDRDYMRQLIATARDLGCPVLVLTVDLPMPGARYRDMRTGRFGGTSLSGKIGTVIDGLTHPGWLMDVQLGGGPHTFGNLAAALPEARAVMEFWPWVGKNFDASLTWDDIAWVRDQWPGPLVLKGILDPEDARSARATGVEGIIVSNHGGRQLDGVPSSIAALPAIVEAVGADLTVLMDGGVRSGLDIVKALALGARACLIGRGWAWALGARGQAGVDHVLASLAREMVMALALTGCVEVGRIDQTLLVNP